MNMDVLQEELKKRNLTLDHIMEYIEFEDECIKKGFTLYSLIKAREKHMPQNPVWKDEPCKYPDRTEMVKCLHCPDCGEILNFHYSIHKHPYCWKCGKALAWE